MSASERQTLTLPAGNGLTLDGLLSLLRRFLTEDGPMYVRDTGRDGIRTAFAPTAEQLLQAVQDSLVTPLGDLTGQVNSRNSLANGDRSPLVLLPTSCDAALPPGMFAARSRLDSGSETAGIFRVSIRGANIRPTYLPAFVRPGKQPMLQRLLLARNDSMSTDDDTLVGLFRFDQSEPLGLPGELWQSNSGIVVPASALPVAVLDGETGQLVTPPPRTWPDLTMPPNATQARRRDGALDWKAVRGDKLWQSRFAADDRRSRPTRVLPGRVGRQIRSGRSVGPAD